MKSNFKTILKYLKERRGMLIPNKDSYECLSSFLIGYGIGKSEHEERDIFDDFWNWLQKKEGKHFSVHWSSYILNELCDGDEQKASELALDLIEEFTNDASQSTSYPTPDNVDS